MENKGRLGICQSHEIILHNLQHRLNFTAEYSPPSEGFITNLQDGMIFFGRTLSHSDLEGNNRHEMELAFWRKQDSSILYCETFLVKNNRGGMSSLLKLFSPFKSIIWVALFVSLMIIACVPDTIKDFSFQSAYQRLCAVVGTLLRQEITHKTWLLVVFSIPGFFVLSLYENFITSTLISPSPYPIKQDIFQLIDEEYEIYFFIGFDQAEAKFSRFYQSVLNQSIEINMKGLFLNMESTRINYYQEKQIFIPLDAKQTMYDIAYMLGDLETRAAFVVGGSPALLKESFLIADKSVRGYPCHFTKAPLRSTFLYISFNTPLAHEQMYMYKAFTEAGLVKVWEDLETYFRQLTVEMKLPNSDKVYKKPHSVVNLSNCYIWFLYFFIHMCS